MARKKDALDQLLGESTLFSEGGVDDLNLTPEQRIALQRRGRTERVQDTRGEGIGLGGRKQIEEAAISEIGGQLASGDSLIVPNVQRSKQFRGDERSRGGERSLAEMRALQPSRSPQATPTMPRGMAGPGGATAAKGIKMLKDLTKKGIKNFKTDQAMTEAGGQSPVMGAGAGDKLLQAAVDPTSKQNLVGVGDPKGFFAKPTDPLAQTGGPAPEMGPLATTPADKISNIMGTGSHATTLASAGMNPSTIIAAEKMGEGALNVAAAQSLGQQAAVPAGMGVGKMLASIAPYAFGAGAALQIGMGAYDMLKGDKPDAYSYRDVMGASEGAKTDTSGREYRIEQDSEGNKYLYDQRWKDETGKDKWIPLKEEEVDRYRQSGIRAKEASASRAIGDRNRREEYQGNKPMGMEQRPGMSLADIDAGGRKLKTDYRKSQQEERDSTGLG